MRTPRLPELTLALSLACTPRHPEPTAAARHDTHKAVQAVIDAPKNEVDQLIAEMETALKDLQAPPCEPPNGPRKIRLKTAIAKVQAHLAKKGNSITIGDLDCNPNTLAVIVGVLTSKLKESEPTVLAQTK